MKCPIDQTEMEKGFLAAHGHIWKQSIGGGIKLEEYIAGGKITFAYRCPKCEKIELTTKGEN